MRANNCHNDLEQHQLDQLAKHFTKNQGNDGKKWYAVASKRGCSAFCKTKYYLSHVITDRILPEISFDCATDIMDE